MTKDSADAIQAKVQSSMVLKNDRISSLDVLKEKTEYELHSMLMPTSTTRTQGTQGGETNIQRQREDLRRLKLALQHLRKYTDILIRTGRQPFTVQHMELHWDSFWDNGMIKCKMYSETSSNKYSILHL